VKTQTILIAAALVALYGCQQKTPEQKSPPSAPAPVAATPAATPAPAEPAPKPAASKDDIAAPVKQAEPAPTPAPAEKAAPSAPKEKPAAMVKEKTKEAAPKAPAAPKPEKAASATSAPSAATSVTAEEKAPKTEAIDLTKLNKLDRKVGDGAVATAGKKVSVHYTLWLYDEAKPDHRGVKVDSSYFRGEAFEFGLGSGMVIRGWDQGVEGMKVGGKRTLIVPSSLGYGDGGVGGQIPPKATLLFDIELLGVR
jgi:FKBP-type peptidyl-prolyl cis-trans isomerase